MDAIEQQPLPGLPGVVRSVRTPEFAGMVFHEVRARSVLNRVPSSSPMPFRWTVNPYRGCSHACTYCLSGDTPVLLADGRTTPMARIRPGDLVYGTVRRGGRRYYVPTTVRAHWSTVRPGYRVTLRDGTSLITGPDHRFLSARGWRYVTAERRRQPLRAGQTLLGPGGFPLPPKDTDEYRAGYLRGVLGPAPGRDWRLVTDEPELLARFGDYLAGFGVTTQRVGVVSVAPRWWSGSAVRPGPGNAPLDRLLERPAAPSAGWFAGVLAGAVDRTGAVGEGGVSVSYVDSSIVDALAELGFDCTVVVAEGRVRCAGRLADRLRLWHTIDPAVTRKRTIDDAEVTGGPGTEVVSVEPLGIDLPLFDMTTGTGDYVADGVVSHNCFARNSHTYLDLDSGADFDSEIVVKVNTAEVLRSQLRAPAWQREHVAMGTNTDPYQRAEGRYRLMPGVIEALAESGTPFSILTKGPVLARDLPLLAAAAADVPVGLGVSIALLDRELQHSVEPGTASPQARLDLVRKIRDAGLPCGVMIAPVLPRLTDSTEQLAALVAAVADAGATGATVLPLHLRPGAREWFGSWLRREHPRLVPVYREIYARGSNADRRYRDWLAARVGPLLRRHGLLHRPEEPAGPDANGLAEGATGSPAAGGSGSSHRWPRGSMPRNAPSASVIDENQLTLL